MYVLQLPDDRDCEVFAGGPPRTHPPSMKRCPRLRHPLERELRKPSFLPTSTFYLILCNAKRNKQFPSVICLPRSRCHGETLDYRRSPGSLSPLLRPPALRKWKKNLFLLAEDPTERSPPKYLLNCPFC